MTDSTVDTRSTEASAVLASDPDWWRQAAVYQIYPRSFADANGDGIGDLAGHHEPQSRTWSNSGSTRSGSARSTRRRSPTAATTSTTTATSTPKLGTLDDFDEMVAALHAAGIRLIVDIVPNHSSNRHAWFRRRWRRRRGSAARDRYIFRDGEGPTARAAGGLGVVFGGSAWDARRRRPVVPAPVRPRAAGPQLGQPRGPRRLPHDPAVLVRPRRRRLPRRRRARAREGPHRAAAARTAELRGDRCRRSPTDRTRSGTATRSHEIYAEWRAVFNEYDPPRIAVAEAWVARPAAARRYASPDGPRPGVQLRPAAGRLRRRRVPRRSSTDNLAVAAESGASSTWVFSNHDVVRHATRYGLPDDDGNDGQGRHGEWLLHGRRSRRRRRRARPAPGARGHAADARAAGLAPTSTRARSSGCTRSPTSPTPSGRTRRSSATRASRSAVTAAACRCRGPRRAARSASAPAARTCRSRRGSASSSVEAEDGGPGSTLRPLPPGARGCAATCRPPRSSTGTRTRRPDDVLHFSRPGGWQSVTNFGDAPVRAARRRGARHERPARRRAAARGGHGLAPRVARRRDRRMPRAGGCSRHPSRPRHPLGSRPFAWEWARPPR